MRDEGTAEETFVEGARLLAEGLSRLAQAEADAATTARDLSADTMELVQYGESLAANVLADVVATRAGFDQSFAASTQRAFPAGQAANRITAIQDAAQARDFLYEGAATEREARFARVASLGQRLAAAIQYEEQAMSLGRLIGIYAASAIVLTLLLLLVGVPWLGWLIALSVPGFMFWRWREGLPSVPPPVPPWHSSGNQTYSIPTTSED